MQYSLKHLREEQAIHQATYGEKYFLIVAPSNMSTWGDLNVLEEFVYAHSQIPDAVLANVPDLDLFFIEWDRTKPANHHKPVLYYKLSGGLGRL